jgi:hypothetical protein
MFELIDGLGPKKRIGIGGAIFGLIVSVLTSLNLVQQRALFKAQEKLVNYQASEEAEKRAVNVSMELTPFESPKPECRRLVHSTSKIGPVYEFSHRALIDAISSNP